VSAAGGILVVGGGIAGQAVCEEVRRRDAEVPLTLVCGEAAAPYDRVRLSHLLAGETDAGELRLRPDGWYVDRRVDVLLGRRAVALDPEAGTCMLDDGRGLRFAHAALCTGSDPLLPPLPGIDLPGVHAFRTPEDCAAIAEGAAAAQ
jgi:nitrite reductase (NADH) large subunit